MTDEPIDLSVEALTGTIYDLCVSPFETILGIKMKIQRLEGIPVYQQQLVYRDTELQDEFCLEEYGICSGAQLKLLIAMRGGPVHAHRIPLEDPTLLEIAELLEAGRSPSHSPEHRLTVMFVRDGDDVGLVRVYPEDTAESSSTVSTIGPPPEPPTAKTLQENSTTRNKMRELQAKIRRRHEPHPGSVAKPRRAQVLVLEGRVATRLLSSRACATPTALTSDEQCRFPFSSGGQVLSARRSRAQACSNVRGRYGEGGKEEEEEEGEEGGPEEEDGGYGTAETRRRAPLRPCKVKDLAGHLSGLLLQDPSPNNWLPRLPTGHTVGDGRKKVQDGSMMVTCHIGPNGSQCVPLPAVGASSLVTQPSSSPVCHKQRSRCAHCGKKTRLATTYSCRCGGVFCAIHRYPEVHSCTYDYKAEGAQMLTKNNPRVVASKIHKI